MVRNTALLVVFVLIMTLLSEGVNASRPQAKRMRLGSPSSRSSSNDSTLSSSSSESSSREDLSKKETRMIIRLLKAMHREFKVSLNAKGTYLARKLRQVEDKETFRQHIGEFSKQTNAAFQRRLEAFGDLVMRIWEKDQVPKASSRKEAEATFKAMITDINETRIMNEELEARERERAERAERAATRQRTTRTESGTGTRSSSRTTGFRNRLS